MTLAESRRLVVVAPHLDDGVLGAGGTILVNARAGDAPEVITVFAGSPDPASLSPAARELHRMCGLGDELVAARRDEDRRATGILGASSRFLTYLDAPYRQRVDGAPRYGSLDDVRCAWDPAEQVLVDGVADDLVRLYPDPLTTGFLFPLAVGGHIDHQIVHRAGARMRAAGYRVGFYEDMPYALSPADLEAALAGRGFTAVVTGFDAEALARKAEAIGAYASQRRLLESLHARQRAHEGRSCDECVRAIVGGLSERSWVPDMELSV